MAKNLSKSGIVTGQDVKAAHVTQSINALTAAEAYNLDISGSLAITGSSGQEVKILTSNITSLGRATTFENVGGFVSSQGFDSRTTHEITVPSAANWYRILKWDGSSNRGGGVIKLSTTGGSFAPATWVINHFKTYGTNPAKNTLKLEQYGNTNYITDARIVTESLDNKTYLEIYSPTLGSDLTPVEVYYDKLLGLNNYTEVFTGTLNATTGTSATKIELPFIEDGTSMESLHVSGSSHMGSISASGNLFADITDNSSTALKTVVYDTSTGQLFRTGSYGTGGGGGGSVGTLQEVTDLGNTTTQPITSSALRINNGTNITPDTTSFPPGQLQLKGNGYAGFVALDATGMHIGNNSTGRPFLFERNNGASALETLLKISSTSISSSRGYIGKTLIIDGHGGTSTGEIALIKGAYSGNNYLRIQRDGQSTLDLGATGVSYGSFISSSHDLILATNNDTTTSPTMTLSTSSLSGSVNLFGSNLAVDGVVTAAGNISSSAGKIFAQTTVMGVASHLVAYDTSSGEFRRTTSPISSTVTKEIIGDDTKETDIKGTTVEFINPNTGNTAVNIDNANESIKIGQNSIELSGSEGIGRFNQIILNSGSSGAESLGFIDTSGDGLQVSLSSSNALYSTTSAMQPNPALFITEHSAGPASFAGSGSAIHIVSAAKYQGPGLSSKNAIVQLASVAMVNNTHAADFTVSTRNVAGSVTEKLRVTNDGETRVTGSLRVSSAATIQSNTTISGSVNISGSLVSMPSLPTIEPTQTGSLWISGSSPNHPNSGYLMIFNP